MTGPAGQPSAARLPLAMLLLLALVPVARADWARDYDLGVRAIEQGDWAEAERRMRAALSEQPEDAARKRFQGQRYDRYLPRWHAGLAAYRQGDCARALEYWNHPASQRVLSGFSDLAAEQRRLGGDCESRLAAAKPPAPATTPASPATRPAERVPAAESVARQPPPAREPQPAPARVQPAAEPPPASRSARSPAPPVLRGAMDDWLGGRYERLAQVEVPGALDAKARAQLLLLRAAARFVATELSGSEGGLDAARADVRAARAAGMPRLDTALFPPRFRQFATDTR